MKRRAELHKLSLAFRDYSLCQKTQLLLGDCVEHMAEMAENSVDSVVCDPPYGLSFMGKAWDKLSDPTGTEQQWHERWAREAFRVLKPGGHLVAFGGTRTYHRLTCGIEDAGFEIRDSLHWMYGSGFPKSMNVGKAVDKLAGPETERWEGWGTALKPAHEPIVLARKPLSAKTVAKNVLEHGTGAININASRVGYRVEFDRPELKGRWPSNVILTHSADCGDECAGGCPVAALDAQSGVYTLTAVGAVKRKTAAERLGNRGPAFGAESRPEGTVMTAYGDTGGASRYFPVFRYQAKASKKERGLGNNHPTVKPIEVMRWLCALVTPSDGIVLDPFMGSGTCGIAALKLGFRYIGIEKFEPYYRLARIRIQNA